MPPFGFLDEVERFMRQIQTSSGQYRRVVEQLQELWGEGVKLGLVPPLEEWLKAAVSSADANVRVSEKGDRLKVFVDAPGPQAEAYRWSARVDDRLLTIRGRQEREQNVRSDRSGYFEERQNGLFHRTVELPFAVERKPLSAAWKNGTLVLSFAKRRGAPENGWYTLHVK